MWHSLTLNYDQLHSIFACKFNLRHYIEGVFAEYVSAKKHDGTYLLEIETAALGWFDLLNFFAFDYIFYIGLFHALGRAVQVEPTKTMLKVPRIKRLETST
jgi:hypothetical protein